MHKSSKTRWGGWSEWMWSEDYQRHYRQRQDKNGAFDTEWHEPSATTATDEQIPRESNIEEITEGLSNTQLQDPYADATETQPHDYYIDSGASRTKPKSSKSKSKTKPSSKSKGKSRAHSDDDEDTEREDMPSSSSRYATTADAQPQTYYDHETGQYYTYPDTSQQQASYPEHTSGSTSGGTHYAQPGQGTDEEDPRFQAAIEASRGYNYSAHATGEGSNTAYESYEYEEEGPPTPRAGNPRSSHIAATEGEMEQLDPRYRVEHSNKFQPGEIFKVLWSEPQGSGTEGAPSVSERKEYRDRYGGKIFVGFRRFIVIANDQGHCTCVPIFTYGGKACTKRGTKPEKHGMIYEKGHKSKLLSGEPKLGFAPVKVEIHQDGEKLSRESRVNYSKLITVEHNVKVFFIGRIAASDYDLVADAVNRCWEEKIHRKKKHSK
ncbi:hypothetical protein EDB81DRAFT_931265 [Dactylonectria macrodidyma]|uniref:DUF6590 domain-containing protein n=1 Tax=Dactylonectria macrodidyma TaxID=307937 RepID=A0A9P9J810_9HYPO|nr:hypothetical protein EDB81DRAFT_931265 [Dactylonectria macrodidyma]